jgi:hypothetical protein
MAWSWADGKVRDEYALQPEKIIFSAEYSLFERVAVLTYLFAARNTGEKQ